MITKYLALVALLGGIAVGNASPVTNNIGQEGNLYLGFYAADEVSTRSVLINLGTSADVFSGFNFDLSATNSALSTTFGNNWFNNSQVYWSLIGYDGPYGEYGSVYVGRPTSQGLLETDVNGSTSLNDDTYWRLSDRLGNILTAHTAGAAEYSSVTGNTGNTHQISIVDNSAVTFSGQANLSFSSFTSPVYDQVFNGLSIQQFAYDGVDSFPTTFQGTFGNVTQLNGVITVVPEPSTYALIGFGGLLLCVAYRRKVS
jgi:hypothetical protein